MKFDQPAGATPIDADAAKDLIPRLSTQEELNQFEQKNILSATEWAMKNGRLKKSLLTLDGLKGLHKRMFDQTWKWAGKFRTTDTNLGVDWHSIPTRVKELCNDASYWIENRTYPLEELAVRVHYRLVHIHPFPNGNGRHGRLVADLFLIHNGQSTLTWGAKEIAKKGDVRIAYIEALRSADSGNLEPLLKFARS